ncbi:MAG: threonine--tRNA ligase [Ferrimicrobium sp.]|uniref:threonine--tRNA ligase n=1 Tax=Ferrimicrobium sp. TaxID=2926050 RepID=UPI00262C4867|nr:threonine--tRNA ligase [Ferrimicrobium sp.]
MKLDGQSYEESVSSGTDLLARLPKATAKDVVALRVNGVLVDIRHSLDPDDEVVLIHADSHDGLDIVRHSSAHVLAQAVVRLFPGAQYAIGPTTEDGFFYDFLLPNDGRFEESDLAKVEGEMRRIVAEDQPFIRAEVTIEEAEELFASQLFKREILAAIRDVDAAQIVSVYRNRPDFVDLCRGPHVPSTRYLKSFRLQRVSGAYWRGDEKRPQLQRIYGIAFASEKATTDYLTFLEESEKRDHRRIGQELDWFHFPPEIGSGLVVFHPKGAYIRYRMEEFSRTKHLDAGYELVWTPHLAKSTLYETSGHLEWYKEGMYPPMELDEGDLYYPKPMNCPGHMLIYRSQPRSYRDLPLRLFEFGTVYRYERSGTLHGLLRVRGLTQDDSHIFCTPSQLKDELGRLLRFVIAILRAFGLEDFDAELSTRPEKSVGNDAEWEFATEAARLALDTSGIEYSIAEGEGAFYAPKIDIHLTDAIGRRWQLSTLQIDLQEPQRFALEFQDTSNQKLRPYMIHRALFGSVERFFAILTEHYAGALPGWLLEEQIRILPVTEEAQDWAHTVAQTCKTNGLRVVVGSAGEPLGGRIRKAKMDKVPYILVVGNNDVSAETVGVNRRGDTKEQRGIALDVFIAEAVQALQEPTLDAF